MSCRVSMNERPNTDSTQRCGTVTIEHFQLTLRMLLPPPLDSKGPQPAPGPPVHCLVAPGSGVGLTVIF